MSKATQLLESAVAEVIARRPADGAPPTARQRLATDRAFAAVMKIVAPRIRHFIRQYGLTHHWEDAEQVCAIGVHRAIEAYDPDKAMFTTFVNWQLRGELQGLRFRLMDDQRPSARKVEAVTISLNGLDHGHEEDGPSLENLLEDEDALPRAEACAADHMAGETARTLLDSYAAHLRAVGIAQIRRKAATDRESAPRANPGRSLPKYVSRAPRIDPAELRRLDERIARDRDIVGRHLFGQDRGAGDGADAALTRERIRQITRRAARLIADLAADDPRFAGSPAPAPRNDGMLPPGYRDASTGVIRVTEPQLGRPVDDRPPLPRALAFKH